MTNLGQAEVKLGLDASSYKKGIADAKSQMGNFENSIGSVKNALIGIGAGFSAAIIVQKLASITKASIDSAAAFEQYRVSFEVMLGSAEKAKALLSDIEKFAAATPFEMPDLINGSKRLIAFGIAAEDVIDRLGRLGDLSQGNAEILDRLTLAYGKMRAKGKVSLEELNMLTEAGVPILDALARQYNVTTSKLFDMITKGKVGFSDIDKALIKMTSSGGQFYNMTAKQATTLSGLLSTFTDGLNLAGKAFGDWLLPTTKEYLNVGIKLAENLKKTIETLSGTRKESDNVAESLEKQNTQTIELVNKINLLQGKTHRTTEENYELRKAKEMLISIYPALAKQIEDEISKTGRLKDVILDLNKANKQRALQNRVDAGSSLYKQKVQLEEQIKLQERYLNATEKSLTKFKNNKGNKNDIKDLEEQSAWYSAGLKKLKAEKEEIEKSLTYENSKLDELLYGKTKPASSGNKDEYIPNPDKTEKDKALESYKSLLKTIQDEKSTVSERNKLRQQAVKQGIDIENSYYTAIESLILEKSAQIREIETSDAKNKGELLKQVNTLYVEKFKQLELELVTRYNKDIEKENQERLEREKKDREEALQGYFEEQERLKQAYDKKIELVKQYEYERIQIINSQEIEDFLLSRGYSKQAEYYNDLKKLHEEYRLEQYRIDNESILSEQQKLEAKQALNSTFNIKLENLTKDAHEKSAEKFKEIWGRAYTDLFSKQRSFADISKKLMLDLALYYAKIGLESFALQQSGSAFGSLAKGGLNLLSMFGGAFADGGSPPVGKVSLVGERGPELFVPKSQGNIIPNEALGGQQQPIVNYFNPVFQSLDPAQGQKMFTGWMKTSGLPMVANAVQNNNNGLRTVIRSV